VRSESNRKSEILRDESGDTILTKGVQVLVKDGRPIELPELPKVVGHQNAVWKKNQAVAHGISRPVVQLKSDGWLRSLAR
jgi:hypothetical protein